MARFRLVARNVDRNNISQRRAACGEGRNVWAGFSCERCGLRAKAASRRRGSSCASNLSNPSSTRMAPAVGRLSMAVPFSPAPNSWSKPLSLSRGVLKLPNAQRPHPTDSHYQIKLGRFPHVSWSEPETASLRCQRSTGDFHFFLGLFT